MHSSYNPNPIIVHAGFLKRKDYRLFIWGEQKKHKKYVDIEPFKYPFQYSPFELKLALFRNHAPSFYGTMIETSDCQIIVPIFQRIFYSVVGTVPIYHVPEKHTSHTFPINGIEIPFAEIHNYLNAILQLHDTTEWQLADDFRYIQKLLMEMVTNISEGHFLPSQDGNWESQHFPYLYWKELAPKSVLALREGKQTHLEKKETSVALEEYIVAFINDYIRSLIAVEKEVFDSFSTLKQNKPDIVQSFLSKLETNGRLHLTSDEHKMLLKSIGAIEVAPFHLAIVVDDQNEDMWTISTFIQDQQQPSLMINIHELMNGNHPWRKNPITFYKRMLKQCMERSSNWLPFSITNPSLKLEPEEAYKFISENKSLFQSLGVSIIVPNWWDNEISKFSVTLSQREEIAEKESQVNPLLNWQGIADFDFSVSVAGVTVSEEEFHKLVQLKQRLVNIKGKWIVWDVDTAKNITNTINDIKTKGSITYFDAYRLCADQDKDIRWKAKWKSVIERLLHDLSTKQWTKSPIPNGFHGHLRPYQHDGFSWLINMRKIGFGACLADDMGLGKTIQTICYLLAVKEEMKSASSPFLLICPTSLIGNWEYELQQFAPSLQIYLHHGQQRYDEDQFLQKTKDVDMIITSYSLAVRDEELLRSIRWNALILDEAQHIKNFETKQRQSIKKISAIHRIALTGTPIENRLKELWSILDLLNDHFLGSYQQFFRAYSKEIEGKEQNQETLAQLKKLIAPFILRRTKRDSDLHLQLPKKTEFVHRVGLTMEQASLYQAVINELLLKVDVISEMERRALILSSITKLKQICNHPSHYLKDGGPLHDRSEKWEELQLLTETIASNHERALIFTQYKEMGSLIEKGLSSHFQIDIPFLHGSLIRQKREEMITTFQNGDVPFFILSLKAGGVGLNLTKANHVIHYDRWWNPAVENQATDRAYRIGQTEDVTVHKLVAKGTLEEKIHAMLLKKQQLSDDILNTNESAISELTTAELLDFLSLRTNSLM